MKLGVFTLSLNVADLEESLRFYQLLGFEVIDGGHVNPEMPDLDDAKWRILEHESVKIGLFQGMFDENILTFMPENVRRIQRRFQANGIDLLVEPDEDDIGATTVVVADPDGNLLMFDQV